MPAFRERCMQCATGGIGESTARAQADHAPAFHDVSRQQRREFTAGGQWLHLGIAPGHVDYDSMRDEFLDEYEAHLLRDSILFDGVPDLLDGIEARGLAWGIVTNKVARFTVPLVGLLGLDARAGCVVCGDTTPHAKPHPAPLLEAARRIGQAPGRCLYVGDDERDMVAARSAGMGAIIAGYGYLGSATPPSAWDADHIIDSPTGLLGLLASHS